MPQDKGTDRPASLRRRRAAGAAVATQAARVTRAAALACCLMIAACSGGPSAPTPPGRPSGTAAPPVPGHQHGRPTDWLTYHADPARSGFVSGLPAAGQLAAAWSRPLDGAVYGQPLVVGHRVIAATANDSVYALDWSTGAVLWRVRLATPLPLARAPCGDVDPIGITSTPVYYRGLVFVLAQAGRSGHLLAGLDPQTGAVRYQRMVPSPDGKPYYDQQRAALAAGNGRIYVAFGGHYGDCGPYAGSVVGMPASQSGQVVFYRVPTRLHAGIWAPGGPAIGPGGTVYVGVGNGTESPPFDDSDSVTALTPGLRPVGVFAPATWLADNKSDLDLGSMTPALAAGGWILMVGKRGVGYLLRAARLGGVGGQVARLNVCPAFGGAAVVGSTVYVPCASGGPAAVALPPGRLRVLWRGPAAADGSPVVGGGALWVTGGSSGILYEVSLATGRAVRQVAVGAPLPHFASPVLSGPLVLIGTMAGVTAIAGG